MANDWLAISVFVYGIQRLIGCVHYFIFSKFFKNRSADNKNLKTFEPNYSLFDDLSSLITCIGVIVLIIYMMKWRNDSTEDKTVVENETQEVLLSQSNQITQSVNDMVDKLNRIEDEVQTVNELIDGMREVVCHLRDLEARIIIMEKEMKEKKICPHQAMENFNFSKGKNCGCGDWESCFQMNGKCNSEKNSSNNNSPKRNDYNKKLNVNKSEIYDQLKTFEESVIKLKRNQSNISKMSSELKLSLRNNEKLLAPRPFLLMSPKFRKSANIKNDSSITMLKTLSKTNVKKSNCNIRKQSANIK